MIRRSIGAAFLLLVSILCSQAHATHIQYVDVADVSNADIVSGQTWTWEFDLLADDMLLYEIPTHYGGGPATDYIGLGSYDPADTLHYVTLRIDPNHVTGDLTSGDIGLKVNTIDIVGWQNPISLYSWGVPGDEVSDTYGIADSNYKITVTLTGLSGLQSAISISNVNLEGCFTPVPEPATMLLLGSGLIGLAGFRRKFRKK